MTHPLLTPEHIEAYQRDGVVLVKGLFKDQVEQLQAGVARNMEEPGPYAAENLKEGEGGRFFDDYCNWTRIPEFEAAIKGPYYFVEGQQTVSFWSPLDPVREASLRCVAGSHRWEKEVLPTRWLAETSFYPDDAAYMPVPDPDAEGMDVREYEMEPGDAVAFNYRTLHGARGNEAGTRRRAFSLRLLGDDARYVERPGPTSPPFPGHDMKAGQRLREDWFPMLLGAPT